MAAKKATIEQLAKVQAEKKALVIKKAEMPRSDKVGRKALQADIDKLVDARNTLADKVVADQGLTGTSSWAMGRNDNPIGVCKLYR